jgi:signal transduction histidine kinase
MTIMLREKWLRPFWLLLGAVHIRVKILGIVLGLVLLLGLSVIIEVQQSATQRMYSQLEEQAVSITRDLSARAADPILINDLYTLQQLLRDTRANHPDVHYAFIISPKGDVLAHTFDNGFPKDLLQANSVSQTAYQHTQVLLTDQGKIWDIAVPIFEGRAGIARIGLSDVQVQETITTLTGQLVLTTVFVSIIGIAAAALLTWLFTRPLLSLVQATKAVERGDFSQQVPVWATDETGELTIAFNAMTGALAKSEVERAERDQLRIQYVSGVITAQEDERKRIARELHDSTSQSLTSLLIGLKNLDDATELWDIRKRASELRVIAGHTLDDVHALALQLRPSMLDDLGLPEALKRYVFDYQKRYPIHIDLAITGLESQRLPAEIETALYRITQEGLTNIVRHAEAENASVFIERRDRRVLAVIEDDGAGFDASAIDKQTGHLGLYGIRERAELLSGHLVIESESGQGTSRYIEIPLPGTGEERGYYD